jgi:hypothetical protein
MLRGRRDLNRLATNVLSRWSAAIIASDDELILPRLSNRADGFFGNDNGPRGPEGEAKGIDERLETSVAFIAKKLPPQLDW